MVDDYSHIENPYTDLLSRAPEMTVVTGNSPNGAGSGVVGGGYDGNGEDTGTSASAADSEDGNYSATSPGGSVEATAIKSSGTLSDVWIDTFIKSQNWQPKKMGFYLDGQTGYAEFTNVFVSGPIVATSGTIGGFNIGTDYIRDTQNTMGLSSTVTGGDDIRFWAGNTFANRNIAPFRVAESGATYASSITVDSPVITGGIGTGSILNIQNWRYGGDFTSVSPTEVSWGASTINFANSEQYTISAGTTGDMLAETYIFFDKGVSTTVFQSTTSNAQAVGPNRVLVCVANPSSNGATFTAMNNNSMAIDASTSIVANSITANQIAANTITAGQLAAALIYAGVLEIDVNGNIQGGQTAFDTGSGFFIGYSGGNYKLSIGDSAADKITWDGTNLRITGKLSLSSVFNLLSYIVADLPTGIVSTGPFPPSGVI